MLCVRVNVCHAQSRPSSSLSAPQPNPVRRPLDPFSASCPVN